VQQTAKLANRIHQWARSRIIADVKPHVIVTFEPHGSYYHPDHLAI